MTATDEERREAAAALKALKDSGVTVKRGAAARTGRPPALPRYTGPPPATVDEGDALIKEIGRTYSGLSDEATAAIMHLRGDADRITDEEDQATGIPDGEDLEHGQAEASTAAAEGALARGTCQDVPAQDGPDKSGEIRDVGQSGTPGDSPDRPESVPGPDPAEAVSTPTAAPAPKARPVPEPTGEGFPVPLWGDVIMKVYPEARGAYPIEFVKGTRRIYIDSPKSPPWLSTRLQDRLALALTSALGDEARAAEFTRKTIREAFADIAERLEADDGTRRAMIPAAVRRVIEETERVTVYPAAEGGHYEIVISGKLLSLTSAQMARKIPDGDGGFNHRWLILFPTDEIDATKSDWKAIKAHWFEIAEVREVEEVTEAETVIDRLVEDLERVTLVTAAEDMTGPEFAWHDEKKGVIWVHGRRLARFLEDLKRPGWNDGKLSATLQAEGYTFGKTGKPRIGLEAAKGGDGKQTRCWPFKPGMITFRSQTGETLEVREFVES